MKIQSAMMALAVVAVVGLMAQSASAQTLSNNLFSQYQTPAGVSSATAGLYTAPHYVPANVGASYYTYQPLQPHEMMYTHVRKYYNPYGGAGSFYSDPCDCCPGGSGLNVTTVVWQNSCQHMGPLPLSLQPFSRFARSRYCQRDFDRHRSRGSVLSRGCGSGGCTANLTDGNNVKR